MSGSERDTEQIAPPDDLQTMSSDELAARINAALEPAMSDISDRLAEAVARRLASADAPVDGHDSDQSSVIAESPAGGRSDDDGLDGPDEADVPDDADQPDEPEEPESPDDSEEPEPDDRASSGAESKSSSRTPSVGRASDGDSDGQSLVGRASSSLVSSFFGSMREEGGDQLTSIIDNAVDAIFSSRGQGVMRRLADQTLQAILHDTLRSIDDPQERYQLYRDVLSRLRPVVREAVDAMFTEESRTILKRQLHAAVPSVLHGEIHTAFWMLVEALSDVTDHAEEAVWNHAGEVLHVLQMISTKLLTEGIQDMVDDKVDPEDIQEKVQDQVDEAREKLQTVAGRFQEAAQEVKSRVGGKTETGSNGRGRPRGAPTGQPPSGLPPHGFPPSGQPPSGRPPSGMPPTGRPPSGVPPSGVHPAVQRLTEARNRNQRRSRRS